MVKIINPKMLNSYLRHRGPYLCYFNYKYDENNKIIVTNMRKLSSIYNILDILEIDWLKYQSFQKIHNVDDIGCVKLFSEGKLLLSRNFPNFHEIAELFIECIKLHNIKINIQINKIGTRPFKSTIKRYNQKQSIDVLYFTKRDSILKTRIKGHSQRKIKIPKIEDFKKYIIPYLAESNFENNLSEKLDNKNTKSSRIISSNMGPSIKVKIRKARKTIVINKNEISKKINLLMSNVNNKNKQKLNYQKDDIIIDTNSNVTNLFLVQEPSKINKNKDYQYIKEHNFSVSPILIENNIVDEQPLDLSYTKYKLISTTKSNKIEENNSNILDLTKNSNNENNETLKY